MENRKYIVGFQNTKGIYLINPDLNPSLEGSYTVNDFKHTLVKELKAYNYNNKTDTYEIHTYQQREVIYIYEMDMQQLIYFKTEDGEKGYINSIKDNYDITAVEFYIGDERFIILMQMKYHGPVNNKIKQGIYIVVWGFTQQEKID